MEQKLTKIKMEQSVPHFCGVGQISNNFVWVKYAFEQCRVVTASLRSGAHSRAQREADLCKRSRSMERVENLGVRSRAWSVALPRCVKLTKYGNYLPSIFKQLPI